MACCFGSQNSCCHYRDYLRGGLTRAVYCITRIQTPWFKNALIKGFMRVFRVDLREALEKTPAAYPDFNAFFTRALQPGARPLAEGAAIASPVDGTVSQIGAAHRDTLLQAKDRTFSLTALLGGDAARAKPFIGGNFATIYLSPRDYHRIHMPLAGQLREMIHIPGALISVSPRNTRAVPDLFARNERVVAIFETALGPMALVLVGALNVASIETVWAGMITPPLGKTTQQWHYPSTGEGAIHLEKGAEMGRFNMGSTVIVLFGPAILRWDAALVPDTTVRMGQSMGLPTTHAM